MENASKALIIAGSILLAIGIIGIAMYIYNNASSAIDTDKMTAQEMEIYNSEFKQFEGTQYGATVRTMIDKIIAHNIANGGPTSGSSLPRGVDGTRLIAVPKPGANDANIWYHDYGVNGHLVSGDDAYVISSNYSATINDLSKKKQEIEPGALYEVGCHYTKGGLIKAMQFKKKDS